MPRPPRKSRRAPVVDAKAALPSTDVETTSDNDHAGGRQTRTRGMARTTRSTGRGTSVGEQKALRAANLSRDSALDRLANEDVTTTSGNTAGEEDTGSSVEVGRRTLATPAQRRDTTGLDLADDSVFGDLDDSFGDGEMPRMPTSAEASSMSFSSFKPRSRQSSIIGRNDPPIRPSSRSGTTPGVSSSFNIGLFRRRAREPSILGTSRKPRSEATGTAQNSDAESEGEFAPEAESTPLNNRRKTRHSRGGARDASREPSVKPASRKRKSEDATEDSARPEKASRVESDAQAGSDSDSELSELSSPPPLPALIQRPVTPNNDEINAPPASSGSEAEDDTWPDIHTLAKRRRRPSVTTPNRRGDMSDISSPPSLTHSPNFEDSHDPRTRGRPAARRQPSPKITTADLTNLLPKRRYKKVRDPFRLGSDDELDPSGLAQDEDELSHLDTRAARKRKGSRSRAGSRAASRAGRGPNSALKPRRTPTSTRAATRRRDVDHRSSDKENESEEDEEEQSRFVPLADDTFTSGGIDAMDGLTGEELRQAAKKFIEVDKWELEFEEVAEPSSPLGAR